MPETTRAETPLLSVERLTMRFGGLAAIDDLSLDVPAGRITGVIGPNGAGKTTCFNLLTKFYTPTSGKIVYNGLPPDEWGEMLPIRASFRHGYPPTIVARVEARWRDYGFA